MHLWRMWGLFRHIWKHDLAPKHKPYNALLDEQRETKITSNAAFQHLRKICNAGFIVDEKGKNSLSFTPWENGIVDPLRIRSRSLLATPETSFLANKYMKLQQPCHRHERVIVEGSSHSDLLIGEESDVKVFPHIVNHIRLAEKENDTFSEFKSEGSTRKRF